MKTVAFERRIWEALHCYLDSTGETLYNVVTQSIFDYINILSHVSGKNPDDELRHIVNSFEIKVQTIFKKMNEAQQEFLKIRREESILLDKKIPHNSDKYFILPIEDDLYYGIKALIKKHPYLFSNDKKSTINDVVSRSILFRIMDNDSLMNNEIYKAWRLDVIFRKEKKAKLSIDTIFDVISKKRRIIWDE